MFQIDVSTCASCGGRMRVVEIATEAADAARVLAELGLGPRAPPARPPRVSPPQTSFRFVG